MSRRLLTKRRTEKQVKVHDKDVTLRFYFMGAWLYRVACQCPSCGRFGRARLDCTRFADFHCRWCKLSWNAEMFDWRELPDIGHIAMNDMGNNLCPVCFNLSVEFCCCRQCEAVWGRKDWESLFVSQPKFLSKPDWKDWKRVQAWIAQMNYNLETYEPVSNGLVEVLHERAP